MSKIVNINGKPLRKKEMAKVIFFKSSDGEEWELIKGNEVPLEIKNTQGMMDALIDGEIIEAVGSSYYRVERVN